MANAETLSPEDAPREIDRIAGLPHPRETPGFTGNEQAEQTLLSAARPGRLHHAWLLAGPQGIGKATLAYRFARFLLSPDAARDSGRARDLAIPQESPVFRQVAAQSHPGLLVLRRPWQVRSKRHAKYITVDEARRLRSFFGQTASGGAWRVVVIDSADDLNISAANAVLKSLEEPPPACVFLLLSSAPGRLPVTIRSRCRTLRLGPLGEAETRAVVETAVNASGDLSPDSQVLEVCLALAQGSPGAALRLLSGGGADLYAEIATIAESLPRPDYGRLHKLADDLSASGAEDRFALFHMLLCDLIARLVSHAAGGAQASEREAHMAERLISRGTLAHWAALWETLQREKAQADTLNLDRKALVMGTFFRLEEISRQGCE